MNVKVNFDDFFNTVILDTVSEAELRGASIAGFSPHENPAFRAAKWADVAYVNGKILLLKKTPRSWNQTIDSAGEDYGLTAAHLHHDGRVLVNRWGHAVRKHYQQGGCGTYEERLPAMLAAARDLMNRYPGLFAPKRGKRKGELRLVTRTLEQVETWRAGMRSAGRDPNKRDPGRIITTAFNPHAAERQRA
jgi:hypothetical protein